jgi:hypothetical protein
MPRHWRWDTGDAISPLACIEQDLAGGVREVLIAGADDLADVQDVVRDPIREEELGGHRAEARMDAGALPVRTIERSKPLDRVRALIKESGYRLVIVLRRVIVCYDPTFGIDRRHDVRWRRERVPHSRAEVRALFIIKMTDDLEQAPLLRLGLPSRFFLVEPLKQASEDVGVSGEVVDESGVVDGIG